MKHEIKTHINYFKKVWDGSKNFEIRKNDRDYSEGDRVHLLEWNKSNREYTGRRVEAIIGYVCDYEQKDGYVVFSLLGISKFK